MSTTVDLLTNLAASGIAYGLGVSTTALRRAWTYRHLRGLLDGSRRIKLVLPQIRVREFQISGVPEPAAIPENVPLMPMPEGRAIAHLVDSLAFVHPRLTVDHVGEGDWTEDEIPFISIGGPSVNRVSATLLQARFPDFGIQYPQHIARVGGATYTPRRNGDSLTEDYGFVFQTRSLQKETRCVVLCGVWGTGTEIAALSYLPSSKRGFENDFFRKLRSGSQLMGVAHASIDGFRLGKPRLMTIVDLA